MYTYEDQIREHIDFLRSNGLDITELNIFTAGQGNTEYVRCRALDETSGRGEYFYQTTGSFLNNGKYGLSTICRIPGGVRVAPFRTYGLPPFGNINQSQVNHSPFAKPEIKISGNQENKSSDEAARKSQYLWNQANESGRSDYLERKGVGSYGIRFLENTYGRVAIVPARDQTGSIRALEFLNPDGAKRFLTGSSWKGLFHMLRIPINGQIIGIAESYVTAATCLELSGIPVVCAFNAGNLPAVTKSINEIFPDSRLVIFADNDRHLESNGSNVGVLKAREAQKINQGMISLFVPDFGDLEPSKEASDWNDLVRLKGVDIVRIQIEKLFFKIGVGKCEQPHSKIS
jgi:phage/plasmid primase-like uncharacterized protein